MVWKINIRLQIALHNWRERPTLLVCWFQRTVGSRADFDDNRGVRHESLTTNIFAITWFSQNLEKKQWEKQGFIQALEVRSIFLDRLSFLYLKLVRIPLTEGGSEDMHTVHTSGWNVKLPECPTIPISSGLSRFWIPESYFRQINKETKYLTWIWVKVKVWTKKTANKNPLPSVSGCIAFVQGLLRLVTSHAFRISGKYQAWKQAWNDDQFTEPFFTEIFIWECWKWCFKVARGPLSILGLRPRLTTMRSKILTRYCPKVGHSELY